MKRLSILFAIASALIAGGCADPLEHRRADEVGDQLERGITGQGQLGPVNRIEGDPASQHSVPQTHE